MISPVPSIVGIALAVLLVLLLAAGVGVRCWRRRQGAQFKMRTLENEKEEEAEGSAEITMSNLDGSMNPASLNSVS